MSNGFPSHFIDPRDKNYRWYLDWVKAMWRNWNNDVPTTMFYHASGKYKTLRSYAMGKQSINKYKPLLGVKDDKDKGTPTLNIDWGVIPIYSKLRRTALNLLDKVDYNIDGLVIDPVSIASDEDYFKTMKAKIILREEAMKSSPEILESPILRPMPGEPEDMEELEIQMDGGYKNTRAMEAEMGVALIFERNNIQEIRRRMRRDNWDWGVCGCKEWTDKYGEIRIRHVDVRNVIMGLAIKEDFSDTPYVGELMYMTLTELAEDSNGEFTSEQLYNIAKATAGKYGNPGSVPQGTVFNVKAFSSWRIRVLDAEWKGINDLVYKEMRNRHGNLVFNKVDYNAKPTDDMKVIRRRIESLHRAKWVVDTDYIYSWGNVTNQVRRKSEGYAKAHYSYHFYAPDVDEMVTTSITEQCISIIDQIQLAYYKLQNAINTARPKGIMIEIGGLEDIPLGQGGTKLSPAKVLKLYNHQGTLVYRKVDKQGRMSNYRPIEELEGGLGKDAGEYWSIISNNIELLRNIVGLNDLTDGSTPGERTLTTVAQLAYQSSNNALGNIVYADRYIVEKLANSVATRLQDVVRYRNVEGYTRALGDASVKFFRLTSDFANCELGIFLKDRPTDAQRASLLERMKMFESQQILEPEDVFLIENTQNLKLAQKILSYKVKKRKNEKIAQAQQNQMMNTQSQIQSAQVAEEERRKTIQLEKDLDFRNRVQVADTEGSWYYKTKMLDVKIAEMNNESKEKIKGAEVGQEIGESVAQVVANDDLGFDPAIFEDEAMPSPVEDESMQAIPVEEMVEEEPEPEGSELMEQEMGMEEEQPRGFSPLL